MNMLQFRTITLSDKEWVDRIVFGENSLSADYNFGNIYIWDKQYRQLISPPPAECRYARVHACTHTHTHTHTQSP